MIQAVRDRSVTAVASWALAEELAAVLRRPKLRRYRVSEADIGDLLALLAPSLPTVEFPLDLRDRKDVPVVLAAIGGNADAIVAGDRDLLDDQYVIRLLADQAIRVVTPRALVESLP